MVRLPLTERLRSRRVSYTYYRIVNKSPCPLSGGRARTPRQPGRAATRKDLNHSQLPADNAAAPRRQFLPSNPGPL